MSMTDRDKKPETARGPLGDTRPEQTDVDPRANPGQPQEKVEDRPAVGTVTPEDYPRDQRARIPKGKSSD